MDDLISRTAAIDAVHEEFDECLVWDESGQRTADEFEIIINRLPSAQRWIPCSERLPEPGEYYLVTRKYFGWNCTEYREIDIAKYWFDGWYKDGTALEVGTVSAWCELPELWKGGQDGTD